MWFRWRKTTRPRLASAYNRWHLLLQENPTLAICGVGAPTLREDPALAGATFERMPTGTNPIPPRDFTCPKCWRRWQEWREA